MDDRMTISEARDALIGYGPAVWIGVLAAIVTFIIEVILCTKGIIFAGGEKKIERARKEGKYAQGTLVELLYQNREPEGKTVNRLYSGIYEYTVEGITRTKRVVVPGNAPPKTLYFYYKKTPDHVFTEYDIGKNPFMILIYIIPVLVAFAVMTALGLRP